MIWNDDHDGQDFKDLKVIAGACFSVVMREFAWRDYENTLVKERNGTSNRMPEQPVYFHLKVLAILGVKQQEVWLPNTHCKSLKAEHF
jgi:hypothetical protein